MKKPIFYMLTASIILTSCQNRSNNTSVGNKTVINISTNAKFDDTLFVNSKVKIIPLETIEPSLIGDLYRILQCNNEYYILDGNHKDIKVFDNNGQYKRKLLKPGKGPGEYISITDFFVWQNKLYTTLHTGKIQVYSTETMEFIQSFPKPATMKYVHDIFVDQEYIYLNQEIADINEKLIHVFRVKNNELEEVNRFVDNTVNGKSSRGFYFAASPNEIRPKAGSNDVSFLYKHSFDNMLYEFRNGAIAKTYEADFGENNIHGRQIEPNNNPIPL
ncbi:MAG TPA: 6-bladed beta-propeller [Bacteroidales bacterium]|nr:6-bladed beta-propeller [Bacteroidales bacterium]